MPTHSVLTLAVIRTLAGINWLAQHFVTERLVLVLQPVAATVIGLGYARVRGWTQTPLERTFFRDRFAVETQLEATIRGLLLAEGPLVRLKTIHWRPGKDHSIDQRTATSLTSAYESLTTAVRKSGADVGAGNAAVGFGAIADLVAEVKVETHPDNVSIDSLRWKHWPKQLVAELRYPRLPPRGVEGQPTSAMCTFKEAAKA